MCFEYIKKKIPAPIRSYAKYVYSFVHPSYRYSKTFWETYNFLQKSQWWSKEKLEEYQMQQLRRLLHHAYENVPYYRRLFNEIGMNPYKFKDSRDLRKIPYLTKDIIRNNLSDLLARNYPKSKIESVTTGGTTGMPLMFYQEKVASESREYSFIFSLWKRVGFNIGDKRVIIRRPVSKKIRSKKFWEYNPVERALVLSSLNMTVEFLPKYLSLIREFQPDFLHVYPSVITILAKFMKNRNIKPFKNLKAILCSSENLYLWQRNLLEEVFQCQVFSWYGQAEKVVLAGECESNTDYHIFPEYGITEIVDKENNLVSKENDVGEIVATGFNNYVLPLIRYKTEDIAIYRGQSCNCGRNYPLLKRVIGRKQQYFVDKNGSLISFIWADKPLWNFIERINAYQYVQDLPGKVLLKIAVHSKLLPSDIEIIKKNFLDLYTNFDIEIKFVKDILKTKGGKFKYLVQNVPIKLGTNSDFRA